MAEGHRVDLDLEAAFHVLGQEITPTARTS